MNTNALRVAAWTVCFALSIAICFGGHDGFGFLVNTMKPLRPDIIDIKLDIGFWYREHFLYDGSTFFVNDVNSSPTVHNHCNNDHVRNLAYEQYNDLKNVTQAQKLSFTEFKEAYEDFDDQFCNPGKALTIVGSGATGILWCLSILIWSGRTKNTIIQVLYFVCGGLSLVTYIALVAIVTETKKGIFSSPNLSINLLGASLPKPYIFNDDDDFNYHSDNIFGGAFVMLCVLLGFVTMTLAAEFIVKRFELVKNDKAAEKLLSI